MNPALSAILLVPRGFDELTGTVAHLRAQTIRSRLQVVVVAGPAGAASVDGRLLDGFAAVDVVPVAAIPTVAAGIVAALPHARGEIVALVEDHAFLEPEWAARVCEAFGSGCAAVAPLMLNPNPATATSWMNFLVSFMDAVAPAGPGEIEYGPGHNTSYRRAVLERYGAELRALLQTERNFHYRLRADGYVLRAAPDARLAHMNISLPRVAFRQAWIGGVMFGHYRAAGMPLWERVARTLLAPLVPPVRFRRMRRVASRVPEESVAPTLAWVMVPLALALHAAGEAAGYWRLVPDVEAKYEFFELQRIACVRPEERRLMTGGETAAACYPAAPISASNRRS